MPVSSQISKSTEIEDLIEHYPFALHYLAQKGIRCIVCGESVWGTIEEAAREKGFDDVAIDEIVNELIILALNEERYYQSKLKGHFNDELPGLQGDNDKEGSPAP